VRRRYAHDCFVFLEDSGMIEELKPTNEDEDQVEDQEAEPSVLDDAHRLMPLVLRKQEQIARVCELAPEHLIKPGKINDKSKLKRLFMAGLTHEEIAEFFGVHRTAVTLAVKKLQLENPKYTPEQFKARMEHEMLDRMQKVLGLMTTDKIERASLSQLIMTFGILFDKVRLNRGESTQNVASLNLHKIDTKALESIKQIIALQTEKKMKETKQKYTIPEA
jgi:hypothetical protein